MDRTGSVERAIVLGIVVVIVTILGVSIYGAFGPSTNSVTDGGTLRAGGRGVPVVLDTKDTTSSHGDSSPGASSVFGQTVKDQQALAKVRERELTKLLGDRSPSRRTSRPGGQSQGNQPQVARGTDGSQGGNQPGPATGPGRATTGPPAGGPQSQNPVLLKKNGAGSGNTATPTPTGTAPGQGTRYSVRKGDTIWTIVRRHYGEGDVKAIVDAVLQANPGVDPADMDVGVRLLLPASVPGTQRTAAPAGGDSGQPVSANRKYEVQEGDTLGKIASKLLGSAGRWKEIYELNRSRVVSPDKIHPGMTLLIPAK